MHSRHSHRHAAERFARRNTDWDDPGSSRHHQGHHGGRGGHRGGRLFDHGELRFVLLRLIDEQPRHGYELIKAIEERARGAYSPSPGVVYPTLTMMEELGYAEVTEDSGKKLYTLTPAGRSFLAENQRAADAAMARMDEAAAARGPGAAPPIVRAMENLRMALRLRLAREPMTEVEVRSIAAALDAAAVTVEQA